MTKKYVNMSGTMKPIMEFGSFRNVQILELPKSRMPVFCLHCGGEIRKFKDMVSCIFVTLKESAPTEILMNGGWIKMGVPKYVKDGRVNFHILEEMVENFVLHPCYPTKRDIQ